MNKVFSMNSFLKAILLTLFSISLAWAGPNKEEKEEDRWLANTRAALDFSFGLPGISFVPEEAKKDFRSHVGGSADMKATPNISLGVVLGYNFPVNKNFKIGPEMGLSYSLIRGLKISPYNISLEEKFIQLPLAINLCFPADSPEAFLRATTYNFGYEFCFLVSSQYKQEGVHRSLNPAWHGNKNLKEKAGSDFPKLSGSIFVGGRIEFPKGIYLAAKFKAPVELFKLRDTLDNKKGEGPEKDILPIRALSSSFLEFNLGVDIMQLL
jgi:hypothetical protein